MTDFIYWPSSVAVIQLQVIQANRRVTIKMWHFENRSGNLKQKVPEIKHLKAACFALG